MTKPSSEGRDRGFVVARPAQTEYRIVGGKRLFSWAEEAQKAFQDRPKKSVRVHVVLGEDGWAVVPEGSRPFKVMSTQAEAVELARMKARDQETSVVIHRPDGRIKAVVKPRMAGA